MSLSPQRSGGSRSAERRGNPCLVYCQGLSCLGFFRRYWSRHPNSTRTVPKVWTNCQSAASQSWSCAYQKTAFGMMKTVVGKATPSGTFQKAARSTGECVPQSLGQASLCSRLCSCLDHGEKFYRGCGEMNGLCQSPLSSRMEALRHRHSYVRPWGASCALQLGRSKPHLQTPFQSSSKCAAWPARHRPCLVVLAPSGLGSCPDALGEGYRRSPQPCGLPEPCLRHSCQYPACLPKCHDRPPTQHRPETSPASALCAHPPPHRLCWLLKQIFAVCLWLPHTDTTPWKQFFAPTAASAWKLMMESAKLSTKIQILLWKGHQAPKEAL